MLKFKRQDIPDVDLYEHHLGVSKFIYFKADKVRATLPFLAAREETTEALATLMIRANSSNDFLGVGDSNVRDYLLEYEHVPSYRLKGKTASGFSINAKDNLEPLLREGYAEEFLTAYLAYKKAKTDYSKMASLCNNLRTKIAESHDNSNLYAISYKFKQDRNLRYNYSDYNIVTIPVQYNSYISVPKGYVLVWGDFAQADFRNAYNLLIRDKEIAETVDAYDDKYEGLARAVAKANNEEFDIAKFKEERKLYKTLTLATMYGRVQATTKEDLEFIRKLQVFLAQCPRYKEFKDTLETYCNLDSQVYVESYFGHTETRAVEYNKSKTTNFCLNSPIQACTSELMILTVNTILKKFYDLGYTEEDIHLYFARHDEPLFIMKESVLQDAWVFKECSEIIVDNWTPLQMDFYYGHDYKVVDPLLQGRAENIYKMNSHKITKVEADKEPNGDYFPLTRILRLGVGIFNSPQSDKSVICMYNPVAKKASYYLSDTKDKEVIGQDMQQIVVNMSEEINKAGYGTVLINNFIVSSELYENRVFMRFVIGPSDESNKAATLARIRFAKEFPNEANATELASLVNANKSWLNELGVV